MSHRIAITCAQALIGVLVAVGIWLGLPTRYWPVDLLGTLLAVAALLTAGLLAIGARTAVAVTRAVLWAELVLGSLCVSLLAGSIAQLWGSYGPVGSGGALLMGTIACLVLPYLVALPVLQLVWLRRLEPRA
jgi:hypothetical protein